MAPTKATREAMVKMMHEISLALNGYNAATIEVDVRHQHPDEVHIMVKAKRGDGFDR